MYDCISAREDCVDGDKFNIEQCTAINIENANISLNKGKCFLFNKFT